MTPDAEQVLEELRAWLQDELSFSEKELKSAATGLQAEVLSVAPIRSDHFAHLRHKYNRQVERAATYSSVITEVDLKLEKLRRQG